MFTFTAFLNLLLSAYVIWYPSAPETAFAFIVTCFLAELFKLAIFAVVFLNAVNSAYGEAIPVCEVVSEPVIIGRMQMLTS